jgi:hypothetical protein
MNMFKKEIRI